jgi:hypothetical protein
MTPSRRFLKEIHDVVISHKVVSFIVTAVKISTLTFNGLEECRLLGCDSQGVTSQNTAFFIVTALKT